MSAADNARGRRKARVERDFARRIIAKHLTTDYPADVLAEIRLAAAREREGEE